MSKEFFRFLCPIVLGALCAGGLLSVVPVYAGVELGRLVGGDLKTVSIQPAGGWGGDALDAGKALATSILYLAKVVVSGIALIYMVMIGISLVIAQGEEDAIKKWQKQLIYAMVGFLFLNIPGQLYALFEKDDTGGTTLTDRAEWSTRSDGGDSLLVNYFEWNSTVVGGILLFLRTAVIGFVIMQLTIAAFYLLTSAGEVEEERSSARRKFLYSVAGLIFLGFIEAFVAFVYEGNIQDGNTLFGRATNLAIFFAGPTAIFFLILGGYYILTAAWEEDRIEKGKNIIKNTLIGVIILIASYTFLKDLVTLQLV